MSCVNERRHRVTVQAVTRTADGDGGFTESYAARTPSTWWCAISPIDLVPARGTVSERYVANTVQSRITHVIKGRYRNDITTDTRLVFGSRNLYVRGVQNVEELSRELVVAAEEVVA